MRREDEVRRERLGHVVPHGALARVHRAVELRVRHDAEQLVAGEAERPVDPRSVRLERGARLRVPLLTGPRHRRRLAPRPGPPVAVRAERRAGVRPAGLLGRELAHADARAKGLYGGHGAEEGLGPPAIGQRSGQLRRAAPRKALCRELHLELRRGASPGVPQPPQGGVPRELPLVPPRGCAAPREPAVSLAPAAAAQVGVGRLPAVAADDEREAGGQPARD